MKESYEILSIKNVCKVFGEKLDIVQKMIDDGMEKDEIFEQTGQTIGVLDISFSVKRGEIFVIMGLSGSGKSTIVRLLNRLIEPTSGTITLDSTEITCLSDHELLDVRRKEMSMVFQSFALMPHMNVLDNTAFGLEVSGVKRKERIKRAKKVLSQVGLAGHEFSYPHQLSGGMQQRVGLARALTNDPTILLMDEAFSALDPLIRYEMQSELIKLQQVKQRTIVFISHDLDEAIRIGDRIAIMEGGRIVQIGTPKELMKNPTDDYVATFFKGVSQSKLLKAGDIICQTNSCTIKLNGKFHQFEHYDQKYGYLVDDDNRLTGIIELENLPDNADAETLLSMAISEFQFVFTDTSLENVLKLVLHTSYSIPVVDKDRRFFGLISKNALLQSLSS